MLITKREERRKQEMPIWIIDKEHEKGVCVKEVANFSFPILAVNRVLQLAMTLPIWINRQGA